MKLRARAIVARHHGGDRAAVVRLRNQTSAVGRVEVKGMHEIGVQPLRPGSDAVEQRVRTERVESVPTHVRDLETWILRLDAVDFAGNPTESFGDHVFAPALGHELHADADAEERTALAAHALFDRLDHAADPVEPTPTVR